MINLKFDIQRRNAAYDMTIITMHSQDNEIDCLIDTGARVPVWCSGEQLLKVYYPKCNKQDAIFILRGFGNGYEVANVYLIPEFILSDGKNSIHYSNMLIAVTERDYSFDFILSYNMFHKMNISIDTFTNEKGMQKVTPNIKIASLKSQYYVGYKGIDMSQYNRHNIRLAYGTENILDSIYIFNQQ